MDAIVIKDLRFEISIGIHEHEKTRLQVVAIDLEIGLPAESTRHDELQYTIDYEQVARCIGSLAVSRHFGLVETLVDRIASMLIDDFGAPWARVSAGKLGILSNASYVGVSVRRRRVCMKDTMRAAASALGEPAGLLPENARSPSPAHA